MISRNIIKKYFFLFLVLIGLYSCFTAGTHGIIKSYQYPVAKHTLQNAVQKVIDRNGNILRDKLKAYNDSTKMDYYNDGDNYITITIIKNQLQNRYTFKYGGDKEYWDTSKFSNIFICYAFDKDGKGGSEGNGGFPWYKFGLKKKLVELFEKEFVNKVDTVLGQKYIDTD